MNVNNLQRRLQKCESTKLSDYLKRFISRMEHLVKRKKKPKRNSLYTPLANNTFYTPPKPNSPHSNIDKLISKLSQNGFKKPRIVAQKMMASGRPSSDYVKTTGLLKKR